MRDGAVGLHMMLSRKCAPEPVQEFFTNVSLVLEKFCVFDFIIGKIFFGLSQVIKQRKQSPEKNKVCSEN